MDELQVWHRDHQHGSTLPMLMVDGTMHWPQALAREALSSWGLEETTAQWWDASGLGGNGADVPHWNTASCSPLLCHGETQGWRGSGLMKFLIFLLVNKKVPPKPQKGQLAQLTGQLSQSALDLKLSSLLSCSCCWGISRVSNGVSQTRHICSDQALHQENKQRNQKHGREVAGQCCSCSQNTPSQELLSSLHLTCTAPSTQACFHTVLVSYLCRAKGNWKYPYCKRFPSNAIYVLLAHMTPTIQHLEWDVSTHSKEKKTQIKHFCRLHLTCIKILTDTTFIVLYLHGRHV